MIDDVRAVLPPAATAHPATPSLESPPAETTLPAPTGRQVETADRVFRDSTPQHPLVTLFGVAACVGLLRDVAGDTFDTTGAEDDEEEEPSDDV